MKLLVTGGAGFIGSALCRQLARQGGWQTVVVDSLTYAGNLSSLASITGRFVFVQADICDSHAMDRVFAEHDPDAVLHLAAESHVDRSIDSAPVFVRTNVLGTATLLEAARRHFERISPQRRAAFRFHHVSTDEIFGSIDAPLAFHEDSQIDPRSPYSASKAASDHLVSAWGHTYGMPVIISNCSNNYGPYQLCEKLIPLAILNARENLPIPVYGDGLNVRDWIFVEDHVDALLTILQHGVPGRRYNVGSQSERTNLSVVEAICDLVDERQGGSSRRSLINFVPDRPGHDRRYAIDPTRVAGELGWRSKTGFEEGLKKTVLWYLENETWWQPLRRDGHGLARLGARAGEFST